MVDGTVLDFEDFGRWPAPLRQFLDQHLSGAEYPPNLDAFLLYLPQFLRDTSLRCFHATRLLDAEREAIRRDGLKPAKDIFVSKPDAAFGPDSLHSVPGLDAISPLQMVSLYVRKQDLSNLELVSPLLGNWGGGELLGRHALAQRLMCSKSTAHVIELALPIQELKFLLRTGLRPSLSLQQVLIARYREEHGLASLPNLNTRDVEAYVAQRPRRRKTVSPVWKRVFQE